MTPLRSTITLMLVLVAVLLAAGCAGHPDDSKSKVNGSPLIATNTSEQFFLPTLMTTISESQCQQMENGSIIISGYPFMYNGTVPYSGILTVRVWIFVEKMHGTWSGKSQSWTFWNTYDYMIISVPVQSDKFNISFTANQTKELGAGKYRIIFQYPKSGNAFDIRTQIDQNREEVYDKQGGLLINLWNIRQQKMRSFDAADILEQEINKPGSGDTSSNFSFVIHEPVIRVNPVGDHHTGDVFFINGTTNLPAGEELAIEISICCPLQIKGVIIPPRFESSTIVQLGFCGNNSWSVLANASSLYPNRPEQNWVVTAYNWDLHASGSTIFIISAALNPTTTKTTSFSVIRGVPFSYEDIVPLPALTLRQMGNSFNDPDYEKKMAVSEVNVWLFGDHYVNMTKVLVNPNGTFIYVLNGERTADLPHGAYKILMQYPSRQNLFDIEVRSETGRVLHKNGDLVFLFADVRDSKMSGFAAADILESELKKPGTGDRYSIITLDVKDL